MENPPPIPSSNEDDSNDLLNTIMSHYNDGDVTEVNYKINKNKGIMIISGKRKNGESFRATKQIHGNNGMIQTVARFNPMNPSDRAQLVKELRSKGYKQQEIADTLGISQSQVSAILNKRGKT